MENSKFNKILSRSIKGDDKSQTVLYNEFFLKLMPLCVKITKSTFLAEDILHEGWLRAIDNLESFKGDVSNFPGWIGRIVINVAKRYYTREMKYDERDIFEIQELTNQSQNVYTEGVEYNEIKDMIDDLPKSQRYAFMMHEIEGFNHKEIGDSLNISEGTSRSNLLKARKKLQANLIDSLSVN